MWVANRHENTKYIYEHYTFKLEFLDRLLSFRTAIYYHEKRLNILCTHEIRLTLLLLFLYLSSHHFSTFFFRDASEIFDDYLMTFYIRIQLISILMLQALLECKTTIFSIIHIFSDARMVLHFKIDLVNDFIRFFLHFIHVEQSFGK